MSKIAVENVNVPGPVTNVDAAKYTAMHDAMMVVMSDVPMTATQIKDAAKAHLPDDLFPAGATSGWWAKTVQLDLEAKGILIRYATKPLSWSLA
ncbi:MAG: hypothetical protein ABF248_11090 [Yoonia sp.]